MERSGHFAASTQPLQDDGVQAQSLLLGLPAWTFALAGLLAGLLGTAAALLLERDNLQAGARMQDSQVARRSVAQVERQRSEEHTSELQSLMRISYAVFRWNKKK